MKYNLLSWIVWFIFFLAGPSILSANDLSAEELRQLFKRARPGSDGYLEWKNQKGNSFRGQLLGFNNEAKTVKFVKTDGSQYDVPLVNLDLPSKLRAIAHPNFGWSKEAAAKRIFRVLVVIFLMGCLMWCFYFVAWVPATRLVVGVGDGFIKSHLMGFLKVFWIELIGGVVFLLLSWGAVLIFSANPETLWMVIKMLLWAFNIMILIATFLIVMGHYDISFFRTIVLFFIWAVISWIISGVVVVGGTMVVWNAWENGTLDSWVTEWILRPLELV
jgi:hypothetical protein